MISSLSSFLPKITDLARRGLIPVQDIPFLASGLAAIDHERLLVTKEREVVYRFIQHLVGVVLQDPSLYTLTKHTVSVRPTKRIKESVMDLQEQSTGAKAPVKHSPEIQKKVADDLARAKAKRQAALSSAKEELDASTTSESVETPPSLLTEEPEVNLQKAPEGTLHTLAGIVKSKLKAGGHPTKRDQQVASRAKAELRRRRNMLAKRTVAESTNVYSTTLQHLLIDAGIDDVSSLSDTQLADLIAQL